MGHIDILISLLKLVAPTLNSRTLGFFKIRAFQRAVEMKNIIILGCNCNKLGTFGKSTVKIFPFEFHGEVDLIQLIWLIPSPTHSIFDWLKILVVLRETE
jgi:hypothetical protein